ncbi:hypothetical protein WOLCODRAFT_18462 [Wolfiporia cocos MD-104 SS10]|uniref:CASP C-terminal domain-containing protein n=1 Tax=Wolfiporia cocos (strain MD-104) TaxID=742152 RepID=A0A2H3JXH7_WOLCO|nr:hypothetical protein WOLCODRAFT_18462 [Wolfiporia cocos MD-104 SS10]
MREENADLRRRVNESASLEAAKKKAESRVEQLEQKMEETIQEKVTQKENELNATYDERIRNYEERVKALESKVAELESETDRLSQALEAQKAVTVNAQTETAKKIEESAKQLQQKASEVDQLRQRLKQYSDYDEIKRELEIMKYVEFAGLDEDEDSEGYDVNGSSDALGLQLPDPNADKANAQRGRSLEVLLATKNKRILEELTKFRILHGELEASLQASQTDLAATESELEKQRALNDKLENDLLQMDQRKPNGELSGGASSADLTSLGSIDALAGLDLGKKTTELRKQFNIISELRSEVKSLQADNLKLYEKVRYMQSYREDAAVRPSTLDPLPSNGTGRADDMSEYRARYEEAMNPFQAFRGRVSNLRTILAIFA